MDLLKGPKGLVSAAIVKALDEYFVVGVDHIEINLLTDTKIVLKDARIKPQHSSIHKNTFGKTTDVCITGFVREVSFVWSWDFLSFDTKSWIKDAVLQIKGCKFKARLTERNATNDDGGSYGIDARNDVEQKEDSASDVQSKLDQQTVETIENGLFACLTEQVQLALDALTLRIADFEIIVEMPSPTILSDASTKVSVFEDPQEGGNIEVVKLETSTSARSNSDNKYYAASTKVSVFEDPQEGGNIEVVELEKSEPASKSDVIVEVNRCNNTYYTVSFKIAGRELSILSYGRCRFDNDEALKEKVNFSSLFINVTETFHTRMHTNSDSTLREKVECKTYPLLDTFSYDLGITRTHGKRFSDIGRGLVVKGRQHSKLEGETVNDARKSEGNKNKGLSFHLSRPQMEAIGQLSGLILAPSEEMVKKETLRGTTKMQKNDNRTTLMGDVSKFDVSFDNSTVDFMGNELVAAGINLEYLLDATDLSVKVDTFRYVEVPSETKRPGISITFSNVVASVRRSIEMTIGSVNELYVPYVVELRSPMENVRARLVGGTLTVDIDSFDGSLPAPEADVEENLAPTEHSQNETKLLIPFPLSCKVKRMCLVKNEDKETEVALAEIELLMNPKTINSSTDVACSIGSMKSKLASANSINACMNIPSPEREPNTIQDFAFSLGSLSVTAGYTIQDWKNTFRIGGKWKRMKNKVNSSDGKLKLPYASIAPLKTTITYNAFSVVSVKETTFLAKAYKGAEGTTVKHLIDFYAAQCLARTPNFLENAELLGVSVNKAGAFSLGATLGIASPIGPFVGVAAVVGVDAVRGSIEAGKRSRSAKEGEAAKVGDFFRGIGYSAVEATQKGKLRRGGGDGKGNVVDWMVGATVNTGGYIGKNKDALGSAGGAGAGVLVGTILGGPVGAVIGGVVGGMTTGTAIRQIDKRIKKVLKKRRKKYEDKKLKPGRLSLFP